MYRTKQPIRLNESQLKRIVNESVKKVLMENESQEKWYCVWIADFGVGTDEEDEMLEVMYLVKAKDDYEAGSIAIDRADYRAQKNHDYFMHNYAPTDIHIATKQDFYNWKNLNRSRFTRKN